MKAFFRTFYDTLDELLQRPQINITREQTIEYLEDSGLPIDYLYFLTEVAGDRPKYPTFFLSNANTQLPTINNYTQINLISFYNWQEWALDDMGEDVEEDAMLPIARIKEQGDLYIGVGKNVGAILYVSPQYGDVLLANNLLEFFQKCVKKTPWNFKLLWRIAAKASFQEGNIEVEDFEAFPATRFYRDIVCLQHYQNKIDYIITRSSIVFFGEGEPREYWLEELEEMSFDKQEYVQLAINKIDYLYMLLDFGYRQERLICRNMRELRTIYELLQFVLSMTRRHR